VPLRNAPLPRMAGHLPFMRAPIVALADVPAGTIAAFGIPSCGLTKDGATGLAPLALRETSAYFGSHFSGNMKAAMDIDRRRALVGSPIAGRLVDLGDLECARPDLPREVTATIRGIRNRHGIPLGLGGDEALIGPFAEALDSTVQCPPTAILRIGGAQSINSSGRTIVCIAPGRGCAPDGLCIGTDRLRQDFAAAASLIGEALGSGPVHVALDMSGIASVWHGASVSACMDGLGLRDCRRVMEFAGSLDVVGVSVTGLDPTKSGMSIVKTGQRLLLTALLDLIYARLGALQPRSLV